MRLICAGVLVSLPSLAETYKVIPVLPPSPPGLPAQPAVAQPVPAQPAATQPAAAEPAPAQPAPTQTTNVVATPPVDAPAPPAQPPMSLAFDSDTKEYNAKAGEQNAPFTFYFTNTSPTEVVITSVGTSCGCTTAQLPPMPWKLAPGTNSQFNVSMNMAGKVGVVTKVVTVNYTSGNKQLFVKAIIPDLAAERGKNQQMALADRQAVFKGECAACHVDKGVGKLGKELYDASCGICHEGDHRATMVADLHNLKHPTNRDHWRVWITYGRPGSLMPAFAKSQGGPLTDEQINSLADYLVQAIPSKSASASTAPLAPHTH